MLPINSDGVGTTGLQRYSGYVAEDFLPELRGRTGMRRYREMRDNSAIIGACFEAILKLFRQFCYEWEPAEDTRKARRAADLLNESIHDLDAPFADSIESNLSMLTFGFDLKERGLKWRRGRTNDPATSSKYSDGRVTWAAFSERAQESTSPLSPWEMSANGARLVAWNQVDEVGKTRRIPAENLLHFRTSRAKNNPEGRSILRNCWFSWFFFKRISEAEAIGISRDLTGIPMALVPAEWFADTALPWQTALLDQLKTTVATISRGENEGLVWPMAYDNQQAVSDLKLLTSGGKRQFDTSAIIERYERRMAMVMLADLILMGHEATGSFALSDNKTNILELAVKGHAANIISVYQADAPLIMELNGWPTDITPKLCAKAPKNFELGALGDFVAKVVSAGFQWNGDEGIDKALREAADFPAADPNKKPAPAAAAAAKPEPAVVDPAPKKAA